MPVKKFKHRIKQQYVVKKIQRASLQDKQDNLCFWCKHRMSAIEDRPTTVTIDHLFNNLDPRRKNNQSVVAACYSCNQIRSVLDVYAFSNRYVINYPIPVGMEGTLPVYYGEIRVPQIINPIPVIVQKTEVTGAGVIITPNNFSPLLPNITGPKIVYEPHRPLWKRLVDWLVIYKNYYYRKMMQYRRPNKGKLLSSRRKRYASRNS